MSDRNRLFNVAIGLALFALLAFCIAMAGLEYAYEDSGNPGADGAYTAEQLDEAASAGLFEIEASTADNRSANEQYHERHDLAAQRGMAYVAAFQLLVSAIGLFFLIRTLEYTADATRAASAAALAAQKSAEIAERDLIERDRPRLFVRIKASDEVEWAGQNDGEIPKLRFFVKNIGERTAILRYIRCEFWPSTDRAPPKPPVELRATFAMPLNLEPVELSRGNERNFEATGYSTFSKAQKEAMWWYHGPEDRRLYFVGRIIYTDHLEHRREYQFCFDCWAPGPEGDDPPPLIFYRWSDDRREEDGR